MTLIKRFAKVSKNSLKNHKLLVVLLYSCVIYFVFFYRLLQPGMLFAGSDGVKHFYPIRFYLNQQLSQDRFPFWTERIFSGHPIYAEPEAGYLSIVNIFLNLIFGPFVSYVVFQFLSYLVGSVCYFLFLKNHKITAFGFVVAHLTYYFSFFHLFHIQHFSVVLTSFLFPVSLYLTQKLVFSKKVKYLFLLIALAAHTFYLGALQFVFILILLSFVYFVVFTFDANKIKNSIIKIVKFWVVFSLGFFIFILPLLLPAMQLFQRSVRSQEQIFTQGSFHPVMVVNSIYPFFLGFNESYKWDMIWDQYFIHETYIYSGIVVFVLAVLGYIIVSKKLDRFQVFLLSLAGLYLLFGFWKYVPLFNTLPIPVFSIFRYWGRLVVLLNLAIGIYAAMFISYVQQGYSLKLVSLTRAQMIPIYVFFGWLGALFGLNIFHEKTQLFFKVFLGGGFLIDKFFFVWSLLFILCIGLLAVFYYKTVSQKFFIIMIFGLVTFDFLFFGNYINKNYFNHITEIYPKHRVVQLNDFARERVAIFSPQTYWNFGLYSEAWGIFGYSQMNDQNYVSYFESIPAHNTKQLDNDYLIDSFKLKDLGLVNIHYFGNDYVFEDTFIIPNEAVWLKKDEGHLKFTLTVSEPTKVTIKIKKFPGWETFVNGQKVDTTPDDELGLFTQFDVGAGVNNIEMKFIPKVFYIAIALTALLGPSFVFLILLNKKKIMSYAS